MIGMIKTGLQPSITTLLFITGLFWFSSAPVSAAGRVFYDGFETGNTNSWGQDGANELCAVVTNSADGLAGTKAGSYMARCNWVSDGNSYGYGTQTSLVRNGLTSEYNTEVLYRFWIRRDASLNGGTGPKICRFGNHDTFLDMAVDNDPTNGSLTGAFFSHTQAGGSVWLGTYWGGVTNTGDLAWHKIEIYVYSHPSNGVIRFWDNGVLLKEVTGNTITADDFYSYNASWTTFLIGSNWSASEGCCAHDATNYLYWDDFEIFTDTGFGGSGSMSAGTMTQGAADTTPPTSPTGLGVQ